MDLAALILSILSLIASLTCLVLMLAKNFFSTHQIQFQPVDPFKGFDGMPFETGGKDPFDAYRDIGDPITEDELPKKK